MAILIVSDRSGGGEQTFELRRRRTTVGKMSDNDLVLDRPNISRRHCQIALENGTFYVRDLASRNGTFLDGVRVEGEAPLAEGSEIRVGEYTLTFRIAEREEPSSGPSPAEPPPPARESAAALKRKIHDRLIDDLDLKKIEFNQGSDRTMREKASQVIGRIVEEFSAEIPPGWNKGDLVRDVLDEALGLGPLEDLLADPDVDEIMVNGASKIYIEKKGKLLRTERQFTDHQQVVHVIRRIISPLGRRIDEASPMVDARLPDGSRVNAIIAPLALTGPTLTIRKFAAKPFTAEDLIRFGSIDERIARFLQFAVEGKRNILISGGTGSGKTTLLNLLSGFIPAGERIITIEDAAELRLAQDHVVSLEARPANIEGEGAIPIRKLVINALRMRPDRIVVGECRGGEALDMLQAMNTGHEGSLTTLHANSPRDGLSRLETLVLMAGMDLPVRSIRQQIASAIHLVVQISRFPDGTRKVSSVQEITGMEGEVITMQEIFKFEQKGYAKDRRVLGEHKPTGGVPRFVHALRESGREADMSMFS